MHCISYIKFAHCVFLFRLCWHCLSSFYQFLEKDFHFDSLKNVHLDLLDNGNLISKLISSGSDTLKTSCQDWLSRTECHMNDRRTDLLDSSLSPRLVVLFQPLTPVFDSLVYVAFSEAAFQDRISWPERAKAYVILVGVCLTCAILWLLEPPPLFDAVYFRGLALLSTMFINTYLNWKTTAGKPG